MAIDFSKFVMGDVFDVYACDPDTGELLAIIADSDSVELANNQTTFYATGKVGVKMKGFDREKTSILSGTNGTIVEGLLGIQTGSNVSTVTTLTTLKIPIPFTSTPASATHVLSYPVVGTAGAEIGYLYSLNTDGSIKAKYAQDTAAAATKFSYASATKTISLPTDVTDTNWLILAYPTITTAKKISNDSNTFSKHAEISAKVRMDEVCGDTSYIGMLHMPLAKFAGEWSLATGTEAAVHNWSCEAMAGCGSKLWDLYIFNEDDIDDGAE